MSDLVAELRQLSSDLISVSPQSAAIKDKHPRILDDAARELAALRAQVAQLTLKLTGCRDLIATLRNRVAERESRVKELEGAIASIRDGCLTRASNWNAEAGIELREVAAELSALLTEASDGK